MRIELRLNEVQEARFKQFAELNGWTLSKAASYLTETMLQRHIAPTDMLVTSLAKKKEREKKK